eukprot:3081266-Pyramimonas_sp.AAC.1
MFFLKTILRSIERGPRGSSRPMRELSKHIAAISDNTANISIPVDGENGKAFGGTWGAGKAWEACPNAPQPT